MDTPRVQDPLARVSSGRKPRPAFRTISTARTTACAGDACLHGGQELLEDGLAQAVERGVSQYVLPGAGLTRWLSNY